MNTTTTEKRLTRSGWTARNIIPGQFLDLSYEGVVYRRSQRVIRYDDGTDGYDWPEQVPVSVRAKVARLLDTHAHPVAPAVNP